ncbi:MAG: hypothetical protein AAB557_05165 [Patescibacteria group bacterium]
MSGKLPYEIEAGRESESLSIYKCLTCGTVHPAGTKGPRDNCGVEIKFLTCTVQPAHNVVFVGDWKEGDSCTEGRYSGCQGVLTDVGIVGPCPGRLTPYLGTDTPIFR